MANQTTKKRLKHTPVRLPDDMLERLEKQRTRFGLATLSQAVRMAIGRGVEMLEKQNI